MKNYDISAATIINHDTQYELPRTAKERKFRSIMKKL
jgi:hypothetical protein